MEYACGTKHVHEIYGIKGINKKWGIFKSVEINRLICRDLIIYYFPKLCEHTAEKMLEGIFWHTQYNICTFSKLNSHNFCRLHF